MSPIDCKFLMTSGTRWSIT